MSNRIVPWGLGLLIALLAIAGLLSQSPTTAWAAKGVAQTFGAEGTGDGEYQFPAGVAVNQATGDVYVADSSSDVGGQRIVQFTASGEFVRAWGWGVATGAAQFEVCASNCRSGIRGSGEGQFSFQLQDLSTLAFTPPQLAVDQSDGSVYVTDPLNDRVQKFTATGAYVGQFGGSGNGDGQLSLPQGVAVDPGSGDVYVGDTNNNRVQRFDSSGIYLSQIGTVGGGAGDGEFFAPTRVAVDSTGRLYVLDAGNARVQRFTGTGAFDSWFAAGAYNGPTDLAIDPANDHVYIAATTADFSAAGILEFDAGGMVVDLHAANSGITSSGIAIRSSTGQIYVASTVNPTAMLILDEVTPPTATIAPVTDVTSDGAVFHSSVNPQGEQNTFYAFEYSTDGVSWVSVPNPPGVSIGSGTSDVEVSQTVTGLDPNVDYRVRLVATKQFNAASATSAETTFTTATTPPLVRALGVGSRTATSAWLAAEVNPQNSETTYHFEYTEAPDLEFENNARLPDASAGDGNAFEAVVAQATGLKPGTEYRYRLVATNAAGSTEGPARTFTTREALPAAPSGRGYEMVSPLDKNAAHIAREIAGSAYSTSGAAPSGEVVAYPATGQFADIESGPSQSQYLSVRDATGWKTRGISPRFEQVPSGDISAPYIWFLSEDLSHAVVTSNALLSQGASMLNGSSGLYLRDNFGGASSYDLLSRPTVELEADDPDLGLSRFVFSAATPDLQHVIFDSARDLTGDGSDPFTYSVYEWANGQVRLVSKLPSGEPIVGAVGGYREGFGSTGDYPGDNVISDDGERIFFKDTTGALYVREHGSTTRVVSVRVGEDPPVAHRGTFWAAEASTGSQAIFTSLEKLTEDANATLGSEDLYLWDADAPAADRVRDLTAGDPGGGGVLGVVAAAEDLSRVFFVARGELAAGASSGRPNLYQWSPTEGVEHVAVLDEADGAVWSRRRDAGETRFRDARLSADAGRLLFASRADVTATDTGGHTQLYLYDAEQKRLECVSCGDEPVTGDVWMFYRPESEARAPYRLSQNLSADGERVFFETERQLVDRDVNGKADVYMWSNGEISLISTGSAASHSEFLGASASGDDVFFTTRQRLVGADTDEAVDVYDARVGGGFPESPPPPPCVADECQPPFSAPPLLAAPESTAPGGDLEPGARPEFRVAALSEGARRRLARGGSASIVVRVNRAGRVAVKGVARVGGRSRTVWAAAKRAQKAGKVKLRVRLSRGARGQLARTGRLKVTMSVGFAGVSRPQVRRLVLVRPTERGGDR